MREWLESGWEFTWGTIRHGWLFFVAVVLDLGDGYSRFVDPYLPEDWRGMSLSPVIFWPIVVLGILWATISTYHDCRKRSELAGPRPATRRPGFLTVDGDKVRCEWFGNECFLEKPVLQHFEKSVTDQQVIKETLECSPHALAKLRYEFGWDRGNVHSASFVIRPVGSEDIPKISSPRGDLEVRTDGKSQVEILADRDEMLPNENIYLVVYLLGWKERE